jgi:hypothetical protein
MCVWWDSGQSWQGYEKQNKMTVQLAKKIWGDYIFWLFQYVTASNDSGSLGVHLPSVVIDIPLIVLVHE